MIHESFDSSLVFIVHVHSSAGDRFIPQRRFQREKIALTHKHCDSDITEKSVLKQDINQFYLRDYKKCLEAALNLSSPYTRLLKYSETSFTSQNPKGQEYLWPVRCRKRPLIKQPHHLLDLPHFRNSFFLNLLDWGPQKYLASALGTSVYLYAFGEEPIELTEIAFGYYSSVKWNCKGDKLITGSNRSLIEVWNILSKKLDGVTVCPCLRERSCVINALTWHPNNNTFASGCSNGRLMLIRLSNHVIPQIIQVSQQRAHEGQISSLKGSLDGRYLASAGEDGAVRVWFWKRLNSVLEVRDYDYPIRAMSWHPWKHSCLAIGSSSEGTVSVWNVNKCSKTSVVLDTSAFICSMEFSAITGELVACLWLPDSVTDEDPIGHSVILVLKTLDEVVDRMECHAGQIHHLLWSPDGRDLGTVGIDETLRLWHFLGPSSARVNDVSKYLKPVVPSNYLIPVPKTICEDEIRPTSKEITKQRRKIRTEANSIFNNTFGCTIR